MQRAAPVVDHEAVVKHEFDLKRATDRDEVSLTGGNAQQARQ
jgi:hypothetical protein